MRILLISLLTISGLMAQNKQLLYDFTSIPQSLLTNPGAKIKNRAYFGIPALSHLHVNVGSSGFSTYDLFADNGVDFNTKLRTVLYDVNHKDNITLTQQLELFSFGFSLPDKEAYITVGMYQETDFHLYFPKDYAMLAYEGNANNLNRAYQMNHLSVTAELLSAFYIGYHKQLTKQFRYGVRAKLYSGAANINAARNKGHFITTQGENNFYRQEFDLDLELRTSGVHGLINDDNSDAKKDISTLRKRLLFGGNLGLGFDAGVTYDFKENWTATASLLDLGAIVQSTDVQRYAVKGKYTYNGINPIFPANASIQDTDYWDNVADEVEELFKVDTTATTYMTWRPLKFNASLKYTYNKQDDSESCDCHNEPSKSETELGVHLFSVKRPRGFQSALTLYAQREFLKFLSLRATYTIDRYSLTNIGLGLSTQIGPMNLYIMGDNLLGYRNLAKSRSASLQFGLNYIFKIKSREKDKI